MDFVNGWLMALAFLLGLVLTLFLIIRRVKREVPEYATLAAGAGAGGAAEVWFRDEDSARRAGFNRCDSGKSARGGVVLPRPWQPQQQPRAAERTGL